MQLRNAKLSSVLKGLEQATDRGVAMFARDCRMNQNLAVLASAKRTQRGLRFDHYELIYDQITFADVTRKYYSITSCEHGSIVFDGIALFESAIGVVRLLSSNPNRLYECNKLIELDRKYDSNIVEAHTLRYRLRHEDVTGMFDIYEAKMLMAQDRARYIKQTILQTI